MFEIELRGVSWVSLRFLFLNLPNVIRPIDHNTLEPFLSRGWFRIPCVSSNE